MKNKVSTTPASSIKTKSRRQEITKDRYDDIHELKPRVILSIPAENLHNWFLMRFKNQGHSVRQLAGQNPRFFIL